MIHKHLKIQQVYHDLFLKNPDIIIVQKVGHSKKFQPCLEQVNQLDSLNQVNPNVFDPGLTFIQNKSILASNKPIAKAIENSQNHMNNVCNEINLDNICEKIHSEVLMVNQTFSTLSKSSAPRPKVPLEDYVIGSNDFATKYLDYARDEVLKLKVKPNLTALKEQFVPEQVLENEAGQSYMYVGKIKEHPYFDSAVEKFVNHLDGTASVDILIDCSNSCELLTCTALDPRIAACVSCGLYIRFFGVLHQPGGCKAFLEAVKTKLEAAEDQKARKNLTVNSVSYKTSVPYFILKPFAWAPKLIFGAVHKIALPFIAQITIFINKQLS